jgi:hypothetical protein
MLAKSAVRRECWPEKSDPTSFVFPSAIRNFLPTQAPKKKSEEVTGAKHRRGERVFH